MASTFPVVRIETRFTFKTQRAVKCISSHLYHWELDPNLMKAWKNVREYCNVHCSEMRTFFFTSQYNSSKFGSVCLMTGW